MATMGSYCKAYPIGRFEEYAGWREKPLPPAPEGTENADDEPLDDRYLFLQETFVVTDGIFLDERIVFDEVTPEWIEFCRAGLEFSVPEEEPMPTFDHPVNSNGEDHECAGAEAVER